MPTCKFSFVLTSSIILLLFSTVRCVVVIETKTQSMEYLSKFGYLNPSEKTRVYSILYGDSLITQAVKEFQSFFGLHSTGTRWPVNNLTYRITKYFRNLNKQQRDRVIRKAFNVWSSVTPLMFTHKDGKKM